MTARRKGEGGIPLTHRAPIVVSFGSSTVRPLENAEQPVERAGAEDTTTPMVDSVNEGRFP